MSEHQSREKFATQVDSALLGDFRALAQTEGRQLQSLVEEAMANLIKQRQAGKGRAHVMAAYKASVEQFAPLYEKLAK
jgi:hypothetical protein